MDLKDQKFGIEIELTGISRSRAAEVAATHFGTSSYYVGPIMTPMRQRTGSSGNGNS